MSYAIGDSLTITDTGANKYSTSNYTLSSSNSYTVKLLGDKYVVLTDVTNSKDVVIIDDNNVVSDTILSNLTA